MDGHDVRRRGRRGGAANHDSRLLLQPLVSQGTVGVQFGVEAGVEFRVDARIEFCVEARVEASIECGGCDRVRHAPAHIRDLAHRAHAQGRHHATYDKKPSQHLRLLGHKGSPLLTVTDTGEGCVVPYATLCFPERHLTPFYGFEGQIPCKLLKIREET
jgi:hypothetical protein